MQAPPPVADETGRLEALQRYEVLETPPEGVLDDLTRLAAYVCQTPIALVTLVDAQRQWFKSRIGLSLSETPRQLWFCAHAIHATDVYVVEDLRRDEGFADHPLVIGDPFIRFYAGVPLRTADGHAIGTLAVADAVPRQLAPEQLDALRVLGRQVMAQLELRRQAFGTDRLRDAEHRRDAEDRFRQLAESIQQVFWMTDPHGALLYVSPAFETIFGRSCESLVANPGVWMDAVHPDDRERVEQAAYARSRRDEYDEVYRIVRPDGAVRWIRDRAFHMYDEAGELYRLVGTAADITEQRHLEEQLQQAQKMEIVGRLAGGVAHDFNNLLTVINGMADLVLAGLAEDDPARRDLTQIRLAGDRAAALTRRLLAVSRRQILKPEVVDLSAIVTGLRDMIQRLIGEDITLVLELAPDLASIRADPGQIEQVLLNLVVNALDAMPDGGVLTIETRTVQVDEVYAAEHPGTRTGPHAMLAVRDTGVGMDESIRRRIFEPFFTTKAYGKGTGLGLSMVYGIVKQSGGSIWFQSEPGHGSHVHDLPARTSRDRRRPARLSRRRPRLAGTRRCSSSRTSRRCASWRRASSPPPATPSCRPANGADALALLAGHAEPVHLVFTDVVMPGMNGRELAARLAQLRPAIRVLYTSGYTEDAILRHGVLDDPGRFLSKPYTPSVLRRRIREALDG